jgi:hypothetical protein
MDYSIKGIENIRVSLQFKDLIGGFTLKSYNRFKNDEYGEMVCITLSHPQMYNNLNIVVDATGDTLSITDSYNASIAYNDVDLGDAKQEIIRLIRGNIYQEPVKLDKKVEEPAKPKKVTCLDILMGVV